MLSAWSTVDLNVFLSLLVTKNFTSLSTCSLVLNGSESCLRLSSLAFCRLISPKFPVNQCVLEPIAAHEPNPASPIAWTANRELARILNSSESSRQWSCVCDLNGSHFVSSRRDFWPARSDQSPIVICKFPFPFTSLTRESAAKSNQLLDRISA